MKPIVIYPNNNGNKITLTKEEFEKYLKEAYDTGWTDGRASAQSWNWWNTPISYPTTITNTDPKKPLEITWNTGTTPNLTPQVTCDAHNDIGG